MSQNNGIPKIESVLHSAVVINQPMVRDYSTGGGHVPKTRSSRGIRELSPASGRVILPRISV